MNINDDSECAEAESCDSAEELSASENKTGNLEAPSPEGNSSALLKAIYYWVLSRH